MSKHQVQGIVVSDKMQKTVVVKVDRIKKYPKYKARFRFFKKFKADDPKGEYHVGDKVLIEECRPISKDKKWRVVTMVK